MQAIFADRKTDFVFKRIFGNEAHKSLLIVLLSNSAGGDPQSTIERWAFFFREAENFDIVPPARIASFKPIELEICDRERIAEQDSRGALSLSRREGVAEGIVLGEAKGLAASLRSAIHALCEVMAIDLDAAEKEELERLSAAELEALKAKLVAERRWPGSA